MAGVQGSPGLGVGLGPGPLVPQREDVGQGPLVGDPSASPAGTCTSGRTPVPSQFPPEAGL